MIRRLRIKFIIINMSIVTLMLGIILGMVYHFTKENLKAENLRMMQNIAGRPFQLGIPREPGEDVRLPYFVLQIDPHGRLTESGGGYYDLSDNAFLTELIGTIRNASENQGVLEEYRLRYYRVSTPFQQYFVFADISSEMATLRNLMKNCMLIGCLGFLLFLAVSILLARWAVKPVELAWQQQRQFVADASHELKTPLTVIMTNAEMLQNPVFTAENRTGFSQNILTMAQQMGSLVEQLLTLARVDSGQEKPTQKATDLGRLVSDAMLPFEPVFFEKGLTLSAQLEENIRVMATEDRLRQVVEILLDNAQKYSAEKGVTRVSLERRKRGRCLLTVANEGAPVSPEDLKRLFKRFYRADQARSRTGSFGLGLSIAEKIVLQHKGRIWAESKGGVNSFFVELKCL